MGRQLVHMETADGIVRIPAAQFTQEHAPHTKFAGWDAGEQKDGRNGHDDSIVQITQQYSYHSIAYVWDEVFGGGGPLGFLIKNDVDTTGNCLGLGAA